MVLADVYREVDVTVDGVERPVSARLVMSCRLANYLRAWWCPLLYSECHRPPVSPSLSDGDLDGSWAGDLMEDSMEGVAPPVVDIDLDPDGGPRAGQAQDADLGSGQRLLQAEAADDGRVVLLDPDVARVLEAEA
jgi:hypothetical protein